MPDLKSLMKAKQASARLTHPNAKYDARGQLSCNVCHVQIKSAALFGPHLQSKAHRTNVQKQQQQQEGSKVTGQKRKLDETDDGDVDDDGRQAHAMSADSSSVSAKRKRDENGQQDEQEAGAEDSSNGGTGLPADFFADPSQAPVARADSDVDEEMEDGQGREQDDVAQDDPEWAAFEAALRDGPSGAEAGPSTTAPSATISAAPVEYEFGAPKVEAEDEENAAAAAGGDDDDEQAEPEETEAERLARLDREEKEEIMQRIEEEELEQRMADEKVSALKRKLEMMKAARKSKQATKGSKA
ncbi:hypothetical protein ACM66B_006598 [Microbotryomycetes sp. NB124-2]